MVRRCGLFAAVLGLLGVAVGFLGGTTAQDATPRPEDVPPPQACRAAPRSFSSLQQLIGTPMPGRESTGTIPAPTALPTGQPADVDAVAGITATVREAVACINAGDVQRLFALYSVAYLAEVGPLAPESFIATGATPAPLRTEEWASLLAVRDAQILADGRVGAIVVIGNRVDLDPAEGRTAFFLFVRDDDRWLIDGIIEEVLVNGVAVNVAELAGTPPP